MNKNYKPLQEQIAEKLIAALQEGTSPFQKPWTDDNSSGYLTPVNPTTGKNYRGMNAFWLAMQGYDDPRWLTFKQASANQWSVMKGARSTMITYVKKFDVRPVLDEQRKPVLTADGKPKTETVKLDKPMFINAFVFNAEQINGIPQWEQAPPEKRPEQLWTAIERAEQIIQASQAVVKHGGNEAYYAPLADRIQMPKKTQFDSAAKYYATLLHELGHWSGHEARLNRDLSNRYGSPGYAKEELRAEIASLMMGSELNIGHNFGQHAAYVESWIKVLKDDPGELFKASADAQRITDFLLDFERKREQSREPVQALVDKLESGDRISYKDTVYLVTEIESLEKGQAVNVLKTISDGEGVKREVLVEFDKDTNEFITVDSGKILPPDAINGIPLTEQQKKNYRKGKEVKTEDGTTIQYSAKDKRAIRADRLALIASVLVDGGVSYVLFKGLNALFNKKQEAAPGKNFHKALEQLKEAEAQQVAAPIKAEPGEDEEQAETISR